MDADKLRSVVDFIKEFHNRSRKSEDEFTQAELCSVINRPPATVRGWLIQAEKEGILTSRVDTNYRYYSISNEEEWQKWLTRKRQPNKN